MLYRKEWWWNLRTLKVYRLLWFPLQSQPYCGFLVFCLKTGRKSENDEINSREKMFMSLPKNRLQRNELNNILNLIIASRFEYLLPVFLYLLLLPFYLPFSFSCLILIINFDSRHWANKRARNTGVKRKSLCWLSEVFNHD